MAVTIEIKESENLLKMTTEAYGKKTAVVYTKSGQTTMNNDWVIPKDPWGLQ